MTKRSNRVVLKAEKDGSVERRGPTVSAEWRNTSTFLQVRGGALPEGGNIDTRGNPWECVMGRGQQLGLSCSLSTDARYRKMHNKYLLEERLTGEGGGERECVGPESSRAVSLSWNLGFPGS